MNEFDLRGRQVSDLFPDDVQVRLPRRQQGVQLAPVLLGEGPVHGRRDVNHFVGLVDFGAHKFRLQHWKITLKAHLLCHNA